ncbi:hypothetical protein K439DRAFT_1624491 [Ramaria rubella]|nr:hypothetical protein K439DRAFT_1624491 [Ramaria rubella]
MTTTNPTQVDLSNAQPPPTHRVHQSSDRLPAHPRDFPHEDSVGVTGGTNEFPEGNSQVASHTNNGDIAPFDSTTATSGHDNATRPLNTQPAPEDSVARGGQEGLPQGKASLTDKIIGKTEKVVGKMKKDPELHEKGELREAGGKAAAAGEARAPHD